MNISGTTNYLFPNFSNTSRIDAPDLEPESQALADQMVETWARFVHGGVPGAKGMPAWQRYSGGDEALRFEPGNISPFDAATEYQCSFWKGLYPDAFAPD